MQYWRLNNPGVTTQQTRQIRQGMLRRHFPTAN